MITDILMSEPDMAIISLMCRNYWRNILKCEDSFSAAAMQIAELWTQLKIISLVLMQFLSHVSFGSQVMFTLKEHVAIYGMSPIRELWGVTYHKGWHSVTCHPTQVNMLCLNPSRAG